MKLHHYKLLGYALAGAGLLVAARVQQLETRETVEEVLAERDAAKQLLSE